LELAVLFKQSIHGREPPFLCVQNDPKEEIVGFANIEIPFLVHRYFRRGQALE
jgi:hypothetical protein